MTSINENWKSNFYKYEKVRHISKCVRRNTKSSFYRIKRHEGQILSSKDLLLPFLIFSRLLNYTL